MSENSTIRETLVQENRVTIKIRDSDSVEECKEFLIYKCELPAEIFEELLPAIHLEALHSAQMLIDAEIERTVNLLKPISGVLSESVRKTLTEEVKKRFSNGPR